MKESDEISRAAKRFAALGGKKGGKARAKALSAEERSEIARHAATARWEKAGKTVPRILSATHTGEFEIGGTVVDCAVLEDGTRVITQRGVYDAIGRSRTTGGLPSKKGAQQLPPFVAAANLNPYISDGLSRAITPILFKPQHGGRSAYGYKAEVLPEICKVYLDARDAGVLKTNQEKIARQCEILLQGFSHLGIIALVDEATGYQYARARDALEKILGDFISKELRKWVKTFPDDFYREMFRLKNWQYLPLPKAKPSVVGKYTNDIVYARLAPGVLDELRRQTPRDEKGRLKTRLFQRLTEDVGHPRLREHLAAVIALMKASTSWEQFKRSLQRALPKYNVTLDLPFEETD